MSQTQPMEKAQRFTRLLAWVLTGVYLLSLLPLLVLSRYAAPEPNDDMLYGLQASQAWEETGRLGPVVQAAAAHTQTVYNVAHGRLASTFFGSLYLGLVGLKHYWTVPLLMLLAISLGTALLFHALAVGLLKASRCTAAALTSLALTCMVQFMASPGEGLFWFCGSNTYTMYYALCETLLALVLFQWTGNGRRRELLLGTGIVLLAGIVSLWGYTCLLATALLLLFWLVLSAVRKRRGALITALCAVLVFAAGTVIQLTAPGIGVRSGWEQLTYGYTPSGPVKAVLLSLGYGLSALISRLDGGMLCFMALAALLALPALKRSPYGFPMPLLVALISCGLFCTQLTPSMSATSSMGPLRQWNVLYFSEFLLFGFNACYIAGWALRQREKTAPLNGEKPLALAARRPLLVLAVLAVLVCGTAFREGFLEVSSVAAARELLGGSAQQRYSSWQAEQEAGQGMGQRDSSRFFSY